MSVMKNQGQSTTEYLLVVGLASFFVLVFAAQMNPRFSALLGSLEDVVASKIAGGKLISHYKVGQLPEGIGAKGEGGTPEASTPSSASSGNEGGEVSQGGAVAQAGRAERGDPSFLGSSAPPSDTVAAGEATAPSQPEASSGSAVISEGGETKSSKPVAQEEQKSKASEKAAEEKSGDSKGKGLIYSEGEEEGVVSRKGFDWMKIVMLILIIILVIYVAFEIFKAVKVNKSK